MDPHYREWLSLLLRWLHLIAGIAWIGSSFYFNWLDGNLRKPEREGDHEGVAGELWSVHGGGFYVVQKFTVAPKQLPRTLHWFKWEAYTTWISGFCLLTVVYYLGGASELIDPARSVLKPLPSIVLGISVLFVGYGIYHVLVDSPLGDRPLLFALVGFVLVTALAFGLTHVFSNRAAYLHVGAMLGTIMAANVFFVIIPGQRRMVDAMLEGREPDPKQGKRAKKRSLHNNYLTLPVVFVMISNHYPLTFGHRYNWALLAAISVIGACVRHWFNLKNLGHKSRWILPVSALAMLALVFVSRSRAAPAQSDQKVYFADVWNIVQTRCVRCHSARPADKVFVVAPKGVGFDTPGQLKARAEQIKARAVLSENMPLGNQTQMTQEERQLLGRWIDQGAPIE